MEDFSKLSIRSKSFKSSQSMQWIIPASRLNQQCPFQLNDYPFLCTDFSMLHPQHTVLELGWRLVLGGAVPGHVTLNLTSTGDKELFDRKEFSQLQVRWTGRISDETILIEDEKAPVNVKSFKSLKTESFQDLVLCDMAKFENLAVNGRYVIDVRVELETCQYEKKRQTFIEQARIFSASISDISSISTRLGRARSSLSSSAGGGSVGGGSSVTGELAGLFTSSTLRENTYMRCSDPPSPPPAGSALDSTHSYSHPVSYQYRPAAGPAWRGGAAASCYSPLPLQRPASPTSSIRRTRSGLLGEIEQGEEHTYAVIQDWESESEDGVYRCWESTSPFSPPSPPPRSCSLPSPAPGQGGSQDGSTDWRPLLEFGMLHQQTALVRECERVAVAALRPASCLHTLLALDRLAPRSPARQEVIHFARGNLQLVRNTAAWAALTVSRPDLCREIAGEEGVCHI